MTRYLDLTKTQSEALAQIGTGNGCPRMSDRTKQVLLEKGLIRQSGDRVVGQDRFGCITIPQYEMPIPAHIAWCDWAASQEATQ